MSATKVPGRLLSWAALLVALAASVAANVAFAHPSWGPRLSSAVAPVLVVLAAGLLERVPLGGIVWWRRWLAYGGLAVVVIAAFVTSFDHQHALLLAYGNTPTAAVLLPIAVDGLIVLASVCLTVIAERRRELVAQAAAVSDTVADTPRPPARPRSPRKRPTTAQKVERLREQRPDMPVADIAKRVGVSERTVTRYLRDLTPPAATTRVDGVAVPELVTR